MDDLADRAAEMREALDKAGLTATSLTIGPNGQLIVPKGSLKFADPVIANVANAKSDDISQVAASQLEISKQYYEGILHQGRESFRWAVAAAATGLLFFIAAVGFAVVTNKVNAAIISALGGGIVEVISGLNFWLYTKVAAQLDAFHVRLERMQRFLLANSVAQSLSGDEREHAISELVSTIQLSSIERPGDPPDN
jgi:hypothetical protein